MPTKHRLCRLLIGGILAVSAVAQLSNSQTTAPAVEGRIDYRASRAFDRGDYAAALPLLQKLAVELKEKPAKLNVVQQRILICQKALAAVPATQPSGPRSVHQRPPDGQVLAIEIRDLGNFDYDQDRGGNIPEDVKRLSGCKVRLHGFMKPAGQTVHITRFALVPSLFNCCFGQPPQIQHTVIVTCPPGSHAEFSSDEVVVEGTLSVQEKRDDGYIVSIFELAADNIKTSR